MPDGCCMQVLDKLKNKILPEAKQMIGKVGSNEGGAYPSTAAKVWLPLLPSSSSQAGDRRLLLPLLCSQHQACNVAGARDRPD